MLITAILPGGGLSSLLPPPCIPAPDPDPAPALLCCLAQPDPAPQPRPLVTRLAFHHRTSSTVSGGGFPYSEVGSSKYLLIYNLKRYLLIYLQTDSASTALLVASFNGREDRVRELLARRGTNPNVCYSNGKQRTVRVR